MKGSKSSENVFFWYSANCTENTRRAPFQAYYRNLSTISFHCTVVHYKDRWTMCKKRVWREKLVTVIRGLRIWRPHRLALLRETCQGFNSARESSRKSSWKNFTSKNYNKKIKLDFREDILAMWIDLQVSKMVEHIRSKSTQPNYPTRWTSL